MPETSSNTSRIAKNTLLLYFRMLLTMGVSLYTSRVILNALGIEDYGIYNVVGGVVGFISFVNNALSQGTSRFIAFGLGEGDIAKLKKIFSTTLTIHILLALLIILISETIGLWFLNNKIEISPNRAVASAWVYHISVLTSFFTITQIPYNACIIAHEKMSIFAYVSIVDAVCKLLIAYLITIGNFDRLIFYAILLFALQVTLLIFYRLYCTKKFEEAKLQFYIDKKIFKEISSFSGWSLFANSAIALNSQGILILLNMFFSPAVVAARSISIQVNTAAFHLVTNFQTAAVPQIVKKYAAGDYEGSKHLLLEMTKYSFFIMLLMSVPIYFATDLLLQIWLVDVPEYTSIFLQLIVIQSLIQVFDTSFYKALYAKGKLQHNAVLSPTCLFINFPVVYLLFKLGCSPVALSWATIVSYAIIAFIIKPILIIKLVNYTWKDLFEIFVPCCKVLLLSLPLPILANIIVSRTDYSIAVSFLIVVVISLVSVAGVCFIFGLTPSIRNKIIVIVKTKILSK